jgi:hypothetical protein
VQVLDDQAAHDRRGFAEALGQDPDGLVGEVLEERRLPVVARPFGEAVVQQGVDDRVRHRPEQVDQRCRRGPRLLGDGFASGEIAAVTHRQGDDPVA